MLGLAVALGLGLGSVARTAEGRPLPAEMPPLPPSPVETFRHWLRLSPDEQRRLLAERPEPQRRVLAAKLLEYQSLAPDARERRLDATELW
jgi:hypothetical protein